MTTGVAPVAHDGGDPAPPDGFVEDRTPAPAIPAGDLQWCPVPLDGVTEVRVHGVGGTPPTAMLDDPDPVQVSGDGVAGFWRSRRPDDPGRRAEAYSWGGLTGRGLSAALWLLALPFALVNLAGWMAPTLGRSGFRGAVRLAGLCITMLYVLGSAALAMDLVAYQCAGGAELGRSGRCAASSWWPIGTGGPLSRPQHRVLVGALVPALVVAALWCLTRRSRGAYELWGSSPPPPGTRGRKATADRTGTDSPAANGLTWSGFWQGQAYARMLAEVHLAAAVTCIALLLSASAAAFTSGPFAGPLVLLCAVTLAGCAVLTGTTAWREALPSGSVLAWGLVLLALGLGVSLSPSAPGAGPDTLPGLALLLDTTNLVLAIAGLWILVAGLLPAGGADRSTAAPSLSTRVRRAVTPFAVVTIASLIMLTVQAGSTLWLTDRFGSVRPDGYEGPADMLVGQRFQLFSVALLPGLLLVLLAAGVAWARTARGRVEDDEGHGRLQAAWRGDPPEGWSDGWEQGPARRRLHRALRFPRRIIAAADVAVWTAAAISSVVIGLYIVLWLGSAVTDGPADASVTVEPLAGTSPLTTLTVWLLALFPVLAVFVLRQALTSPGARRVAATAWDVATFWPRSFHPLAPPSYAERAVPELRSRIERLLDGEGRDRPGAVLLLGHSQGSVLVAAVLAGYLGEDRARLAGCRGRLAVVTYGSPLTRLYARHFPAYVTPGLLADLPGLVADGDRPGWRNFWRDTDPVGALPLDPAAGAPHECYLPDPPVRWHPPGDTRQPLRGHAEGGYRQQSAFATHLAAEHARLSSRLRAGR